MEPTWTPMAPHPQAPRGRWRRSPAFTGMGTDGIFLPHPRVSRVLPGRWMLTGGQGYCQLASM
jgi:hypothetical protein